MSTALATPPPSSDVMLLPTPRIQVVPFAVSVPASMDVPVFDDDYYDEDDDDEAPKEANESLEDDFVELAIQARQKPLPPKPIPNNSNMKGIGMVGTLTVCQTSYMVWFGWGQTEEASSTSSSSSIRNGVNQSRLSGSTAGSASTRMGQLVIAMPPKRFVGGGAFTSPASAESSTSKLIGGDGDDGDGMVARQMAARLSAKSHKPVLVSCHLDPAHIQSMGLDPDLLHARAAALVEQRIWTLMQAVETKP